MHRLYVEFLQLPKSISKGNSRLDKMNKYRKLVLQRRKHWNRRADNK